MHAWFINHTLKLNTRRYNGVEVSAVNGILPLDIERFGAVLATAKGPDSDPELAALMKIMAGYDTKRIAFILECVLLEDQSFT
jgi:hypothetical protein